MKVTRLIALMYVISLNMIFAQGKTKSTPLVLPQIEVVPFMDTQNNRQYELYIELPEGYSENPDKQYPVLYYTDAAWHMEVLSAGAEYILTDAILVGISWQKDINKELIEEHGARVSRYRDYSMVKSSKPEVQAKYQLGQAGNHLAFIQKDVIPFVERNYRTDSDNRAYFGYSASGAFGAYTLMSQPNTFKHYILGSPALRGDIPELKRLNSKLASTGAINANVYIAYGSDEEASAAYIDQFIDLLKSRDDPRLSLTHQVLEGNHQTAFPLTGVKSMSWLAEKTRFPILEGPYLGQKPPGLTPEVFAPGIISLNGRYEHGISFSPDLDEVYFSANKKRGLTAIYFSKIEDGKWTEIKTANFTKGEKEEEMHPFVSPDGQKIYFVGLNANNTDVKVWHVDRLENSWSNAKRLDSPINKDKLFYPNLAENGDFFYTDISDFRNKKIKYVPHSNGRFPEVKEVGVEFGTHAFIAPSQDFLLVNGRNKEDETRNDHDIYVYFKKADGTWTEPITLGESVNSTFGETVPSITPDGKYLFFSRYNEEGGLSNFYWVSTEVIDKVKPVDL